MHDHTAAPRNGGRDNAAGERTISGEKAARIQQIDSLRKVATCTHLHVPLQRSAEIIAIFAVLEISMWSQLGRQRIAFLIPISYLIDWLVLSAPLAPLLRLFGVDCNSYNLIM